MKNNENSDQDLPSENITQLFEDLQNNAEKSVETLLSDAEKLCLLAQDTNDPVLLCKILTYIGRGNRLTGDSFKSISYLNKAYILLNSEIPQRKDLLAAIYRGLGNVYSNNLQDYLTAIDYLFKGYSLNITELNSTFLNNIGSNYNSLGQYDKAMVYINKGIVEATKNGYEVSLAFLKFNLADNIQMSRNYVKSIELFQDAIDQSKKSLLTELKPLAIANANYIYAYSYHGLSNIYLKLNELDSARQNLEAGKAISINTNQFASLSSLYLLEGKILLHENKLEAYHKIAQESIKFCSEKNLLADKQVWLKDLQDIYEKSKDFEKAYLTTKQIIQNSEELKSRHKEFNISQILVNKEEEILALENKNRITQLQKEELKQFAYIVTHDLKTPLSNISKFAGLFKRKYENSIDEKGNEYLSYVTDSAQQLYTMLSALFQYISIEKDDDESIEKCHVKNIIDGILKKNLINPEQFSINLNNNHKAPIRDFHLEIIMENLIRNAIKFKKEDEELFLEITLNQTDQEYIFKVSDNGIGIDDQYKTQIFEIFKRLNKNDSLGTGIGLSLCKKIVQNYVGNIWVEDNSMKGTTFCFTIAKSD